MSNIVYFTDYAEKKFETLNNHKVFFTRENVINCVEKPDKLYRKGIYFFATQDCLGVVYKKNSEEVILIQTFYPIKL